MSWWYLLTNAHEIKVLFNQSVWARLPLSSYKPWEKLALFWDPKDKTIFISACTACHIDMKNVNALEHSQWLKGFWFSVVCRHVKTVCWGVLGSQHRNETQGQWQQWPAINHYSNREAAKVPFSGYRIDDLDVSLLTAAAAEDCRESRQTSWSCK